MARSFLILCFPYGPIYVRQAPEVKVIPDRKRRNSAFKQQQDELKFARSHLHRVIMPPQRIDECIQFEFTCSAVLKCDKGWPFWPFALLADIYFDGLGVAARDIDAKMHNPQIPMLHTLVVTRQHDLHVMQYFVNGERLIELALSLAKNKPIKLREFLDRMGESLPKKIESERYHGTEFLWLLHGQALSTKEVHRLAVTLMPPPAAAKLWISKLSQQKREKRRPSTLASSTLAGSYSKSWKWGAQPRIKRMKGLWYRDGKPGQGPSLDGITAMRRRQSESLIVVEDPIRAKGSGNPSAAPDNGFQWGQHMPEEAWVYANGLLTQRLYHLTSMQPLQQSLLCSCILNLPIDCLQGFGSCYLASSISLQKSPSSVTQSRAFCRFTSLFWGRHSLSWQRPSTYFTKSCSDTNAQSHTTT